MEEPESLSLAYNILSPIKLVISAVCTVCIYKYLDKLKMTLSFPLNQILYKHLCWSGHKSDSNLEIVFHLQHANHLQTHD